MGVSPRRSVLRRRHPSRVAAGPCDESLTLTAIARWDHRIPEHPGAAHLCLGDRLEDDAGELDHLGGDDDILADTASQVPGVDEEVQRWKAQPIADGAPTDWRINFHRQVNVGNCASSRSYERVPPGAWVTHDSGTWGIAGRPLGLSPREKVDSEPDGRTD